MSSSPGHKWNQICGNPTNTDLCVNIYNLTDSECSYKNFYSSLSSPIGNTTTSFDGVESELCKVSEDLIIVNPPTAFITNWIRNDTCKRFYKRHTGSGDDTYFENKFSVPIFNSHIFPPCGSPISSTFMCDGSDGLCKPRSSSDGGNYTLDECKNTCRPKTSESSSSSSWKIWLIIGIIIILLIIGGIIFHLYKKHSRKTKNITSILR